MQYLRVFPRELGVGNTLFRNTTFGLVPSGRSPATYRLAEVMSAGAIPVFVARDMVRPFPERVDWPSLSFCFSPEEVGPTMMATLRSVPPAELLVMQVTVFSGSDEPKANRMLVQRIRCVLVTRGVGKVLFRHTTCVRKKTSKLAMPMLIFSEPKRGVALRELDGCLLLLFASIFALP